MPASSPLALRIQNAYVVDDEGHWRWQKYKDENGYGIIRSGARLVKAHRASCEIAVGPIPDGLVIDHLCRQRDCINPQHLEPVTPGENWRRSPRVGAPFCKHGHPQTPDNVGYQNGGYRFCRVCQRHRRKVARQLAKAAR